MRAAVAGLCLFYGLYMKEYLKKAGRGKDGAKDLTMDEAQSAFGDIIYGRATPVQVGAFYAVMRMKGERREELAGFLKSARLACKTIDLAGDSRFKDRGNIIDVATPYDGKVRSPHILPSAVFIAAGAGADVISHGSTKVPSKEADGFYDVLLKMGCSFLGTSKKITEALAETGFVYYYQSAYSPKLFSLLALRREYGLRTFINVIEKSLNLFNVKKTLVSVFHEPYFKLQSDLSMDGGFESWFVVGGLEGGVEPLPDKESKLLIGSLGTEEIVSLNPKDLGLNIDRTKLASMASIESADMNQKVLDGGGESLYRDFALYSAALIVFASGVSDSMEDALTRCEKSLTSGEALGRFKDYKKITSSFS